MDNEASKMWNNLIEEEMAQPKYDIQFEESTHTYTVNGEVKRSVTQILRGAGVLGEYDGIPQKYMDRGTRVHDACELLAQGWISSDEVEDDIKVYVQNFDLIMFKMGLEYVSSEQVMYDPEYDYCGKYDLIMLWEGKRTLVELKTSTFPMHGGLQIAAYERMLDVDRVLGMALKDGKVFSKDIDWEKNHDAWRDINTGFFDHGEWKKDRKRRRMRKIL